MWKRNRRALEKLVQAGLEVGYCARFGEVDVRLVSRGAKTADLVSQAEQIVRSLIGKHIFGADDDELHSVVIQSLTARGETLAVAESCTGGFLAHRLTNVPGASAVFLGGWVTYSDEAKRQFLGVQQNTLAQHGAVSDATAREMAEGARARMNATYAWPLRELPARAAARSKSPGHGLHRLGRPRRDARAAPGESSRRESFKLVIHSRRSSCSADGCPAPESKPPALRRDGKKDPQAEGLRVRGEGKAQAVSPLFPMASTGQPSIASLHWPLLRVIRVAYKRKRSRHRHSV